MVEEATTTAVAAAAEAAMLPRVYWLPRAPGGGGGLEEDAIHPDTTTITVPARLLQRLPRPCQLPAAPPRSPTAAATVRVEKLLRVTGVEAWVQWLVQRQQRPTSHAFCPLLVFVVDPRALERRCCSSQHAGGQQQRARRQQLRCGGDDSADAHCVYWRHHLVGVHFRTAESCAQYVAYVRRRASHLGAPPPSPSSSVGLSVERFVAAAARERGDPAIAAVYTEHITLRWLHGDDHGGEAAAAAAAAERARNVCDLSASRTMAAYARDVQRHLLQLLPSCTTDVAIVYDLSALDTTARTWDEAIDDHLMTVPRTTASVHVMGVVRPLG